MNIIFGLVEIELVLVLLLVNWGYYIWYFYQCDLVMLLIINGIERKLVEFKDIIECVGFKLCKIWDCRSQVGLVEVVLFDLQFV